MIFDKIKLIAEEKKLSIYRIEKDTSIANGTISRWNTSTPSSENLMKVAKYLNTTVEYLLSEDTEKAKEG